MTKTGLPTFLEGFSDLVFCWMGKPERVENSEHIEVHISFDFTVNITVHITVHISGHITVHIAGHITVRITKHIVVHTAVQITVPINEA